MFLKKKKLLIWALAFICAMLVVAIGATSLMQFKDGAQAYDSTNMPTGDKLIGNIYDSSTGSFSKDNLDKLAQSLKNSDGSSKYSDINSLIEYAESGGVVTAADFGDIAVYFGKANNGTGDELAWIPAYVSKDINGNAILTLWLATTESSNDPGNLREQEVSKFSDGTSSDQRTSPWPSSNNYSTSYIRAMINNGGSYYGVWDGTYDPQKKSLAASSSNKFAMYATGKLKDYITEPAKVSWQKDAGYLIGDPKYINDNYVTSHDRSDPWSSADWLNDKLWLPSVYELYKKEIPTTDINNGIFDNPRGGDGGLWATNTDKKEAAENSYGTWLRTGFLEQTTDAITHDTMFILAEAGSVAACAVTSTISVRPALHLNLSAVLDTLTPKVSVKIGGGGSADPSPTEYTSIEAAWNAMAAASSATVTLLADVTTSQSFTVAQSKNITLDLNGHSLTGSFDNSLILVKGNFTLKDSNKTSKHKYNIDDTTGKWIFGEDGIYTLEGGYITNLGKPQDGGGVKVWGGTFTMKGGTIAGCEASLNGGGVWGGDYTVAPAAYCKFVLEGGTIAGNVAPNGGGLYVISNSKTNGGRITFEMKGGGIKDNFAYTATGNGTGGGIFVASAKISMQDGIISGNVSKSNSTANGGGVYISFGTFTMTGGKISGNTAQGATNGNGGGVIISSGTFTMENGTIDRNTAKNDGGGVCVSSGTFTMNSGTISDNTSKIDGGGVSVSGGTFTMENGTISDNNAKGYGGGVYISSGTFEMNGGSIYGNKACDGGGVGIIGIGTFTMTAGTIGGSSEHANVATDHGGAVYIDSARGNFNMKGGELSHNSAEYGVGGVYITEGTFKMEGGKISGNSDGGVYMIPTDVSHNRTTNMSVSGAVNITGNGANNVCLPLGQQITIDGALSDKAKIGITLAEGYTDAFTSGYYDNNKYGESPLTPMYFVSDNKALPCVYLDGANEVCLGVHTYGSDGKCTQCQKQMTAEVEIGGKKSYGTLEEVWAVANGDGVSQSNPATVTMFTDATIQETLVVKSGKQITLVLNGHKLEFAGASGSVIRVEGMFKAQHSPDGSYVTATQNTVKNPNDNYKEVTISGSVITGGKGTEQQQSDGKTVTLGGGVFVVEYGSFTLDNNVAVAGNTADFGGGVRVDKDATFTMQDAEISYNRANIDGGGLCVCNAQSISLAGVIQSNAAAAGGGIYFEGSNSQGIASDYKTQGVLVVTQNKVTVKDKVDYSGRGGGIYIDDCTVEIGGTGVTSVGYNTSTKEGGGVYVTANGTLKAFGKVDIVNNKKEGKKNNVFLNGTDNKIVVSGEVISDYFFIYVNNTGAVVTGLTSTTNVQNSVPAVFFYADDEANDCVWISNADSGEVTIGHEGGTATCQQLATCEHCGSTYGEKGEHTFEQYDNDVHCSACGVKAVAAIIYINGNDCVYYATFDAAWEAAVSGDTKYLVLLSNAYIENTVMLTSGQTLYLCLNGYKLELTGDSGSVIKSYGVLNVFDSIQTSGGSVMPEEVRNLVKYYNKGYHTVFDPVKSQNVSLSGGLITGGKGTLYDVSKVGGGIFQSGGSLSIYGGYIAGNTADLGGGVYINGGRLSISRCTVSYNRATDGGGVYAYNLSSFDLSSKVSYNLATRGGGIFFDNSALNVSTYHISGEVQSNSATAAKTGVSNDGGGIYVKTSRVEILNGAVISNNIASSNGGGIYLQSGFITMEGSISENHSVNGGGVYVELGEFTMTGGNMFNNNATADGGGVYIKNGAFEMSDGEIYRNQAANGGGIYSLAARNFTISGTAKIGKPYIQKSSSSYEWGNTAEYGGGVFLRGGTLTMNGGKIQYNCATNDGGGLYVDNGNGSTFDMSGGEISGNDAARNGGGVYYSGTRFNVSGNAVIADNTKGAANNNVFLCDSRKISVVGTLDTAFSIYINSVGKVVIGCTESVCAGGSLLPSDFFAADSEENGCIWRSDEGTGEITIGHNYNADGVCTECGSIKQIYWGISEDGTLILSGSVSNITSDEVNSFDFNESFASSSAPWFSQAASIKRIVIKDGVAPTKMTFWFRYLSNVEAIDMSGLDASNVTDMASLFNGCSKLTEIIFPEVFDTSKLTDMNAMFYGCSSLTYVDVTKFDTSHVSNMYGLFANCSSLTSIDLSSFDISRCSDLNDMFKGCTALMTVKAPSTVGTKEAPLPAAFADSEGNVFTSLTSAAEGKTLTKITKQYWGVFDDGKRLIISGFESDVQGAQSKGSFDIDAQFSPSDSAPWNDFKDSIVEVTITKGVAPKSTAYWFYGFDKLTDIDMTGLHLTKGTDTNAMLDGCTALMTVGAPLHIEVIIALPAAFVDVDRVEFSAITATVAGKTLTKAIKIYWGVFDEGKTLIISGLESDVQNATENGNFYFDFEFDPSQYGHHEPWAHYALNIEQVRIINGVAPKYMARWFMDFNKLVDIDFSGLDTSNVVSMESLFYNCTSLTSLDLSNFNTEKVTDMRNMFCGCAKLTSLDISSFDTSNLTAASIEGEGGNPNMVLMFEHCDKLNTIKAPKKMNDMFALMPAKHLDEFTLVSVNFWNGTNDVTVLSKTSVGKTLTRHDGHSYSWVSVSDATCTQAGSKKQVCSVCGAEGSTQTVAALGHSWGEPVWTWSADGKTASAKFTCSHDGTHVNTLNATITSAVKTAATCNDMGTTTYTAKVTLDGREYTSTKDVTDIAKLAHSFDEWHEMIAPTCVATGTKGYKDCLLCHKHFDADGEEIAELTIAIDENAHSYGEWHETIAPTCVATGTKGYKDCLLCHKHFDADGEEITELTIAIDENAHLYGEWIITKESTLDEFGEKKRICAHNEAHVETVQIPKRVAQLVKPDENGGASDEVIITIPDGFAPDIELVVTEISQDNFDRYQDLAKAANGVIGLVYDVTLKSNGVSVQPDGTLTIKLRIPQNLKGKTFKLFHLHDGEAADMEYTVEGDYAVISTDKLAEFVFVGEAETHSASNTVWIVLISILAVIVAAEIGYIVYQEVRKKKATEGRI